jgi:DNA-binding CsgD family transcriptional regulator
MTLMAQAIYDMTSEEVSLLTGIVARLCRPEPEEDFREEVFPSILKLLRADFLASFRWNRDAQRFDDPFIINQDQANVERYLSWFQFHDPVSRKLQALWRPAFVEEVISRKQLCQSEFFNDFLMQDGLDHGINLFPQGTERTPADLRIWRRASSPDFGPREIDMLFVLSPYLEQAERALGPNPMSLLTRREREVADLVARGCSDKDISRVLNLAFGTVRSHLQNCFEKLHCANRAELAAFMARRIGPSGM